MRLYEQGAESERWLADDPEALRCLDMLNAEITASAPASTRRSRADGT